jgi:hypothetical protein
MALQIKGTPVLKGRDAKDFSKRLHEKANTPVSKGEYKRAEEVYRKMQDKSCVCR